MTQPIAMVLDGQPGERAPSPKVVGHALDRFIGTWSAEQATELLQAIKVFEQGQNALPIL